MIVPSSADVYACRSALSEHLSVELSKALAATGCIPDLAGDLADSVAAYVAEQWADQALPTDFLSLMISRALHASGNEEASSQWLECQFGERLKVEAALELAVRHGFSLKPLEFVSRKLLRASRWIVNRGGVTWILDFGQVRSEPGMLEIAFFQTLRSLLEGVAEVWDSSGGGGVLGLAGLAAHIETIAGHGHAPGESKRRLQREIVDFCSVVLGSLAYQRGWQTTPEVVLLDAHG